MSRVMHSEHSRHAAVDGKVGPERLDRLDPGGRVPLETVAHAGNLVVARREVAPPVARIVELGRFELLQRVGVPGDELGHGAVELLAQHRPVARLDHDLLGRLLEHLEGADPGVHVRHRGDPIEVVVVIRIGVRRQAEFLPPAADEAAPEEIADRHAVRLLVPEGLLQAIQLPQRVRLSASRRKRPFRSFRTCPWHRSSWMVTARFSGWFNSRAFRMVV